VVDVIEMYKKGDILAEWIVGKEIPANKLTK